MPGLSVYTFYGDTRDRKKAVLEEHDIVITSYSTLLADSNKGSKAKAGLLSVDWLRLVCDEAHSVRNSASKTFSVLKEVKRKV